MKKLPPYGKRLYDLQCQNQHPSNSINLFIGNHAWQKGEAFSRMYPARTLILPPWFSPNEYHWPVNQCDILIFDTGYAEEEYLDELAICLYQSGANIIRYIAPDFSLTIYHKEL